MRAVTPCRAVIRNPLHELPETEVAPTTSAFSSIGPELNENPPFGGKREETLSYAKIPYESVGVAMAGFIEGVDRRQSTLFPARFDKFVAEDNPVRAVDIFVDSLEFGKLGFCDIQPLATGGPGYSPATMLKI